MKSRHATPPPHYDNRYMNDQYVDPYPMSPHNNSAYPPSDNHLRYLAGQAPRSASGLSLHGGMSMPEPPTRQPPPYQGQYTPRQAEAHGGHSQIRYSGSGHDLRGSDQHASTNHMFDKDAAVKEMYQLRAKLSKNYMDEPISPHRIPSAPGLGLSSHHAPNPMSPRGWQLPHRTETEPNLGSRHDYDRPDHGWDRRDGYRRTAQQLPHGHSAPIGGPRQPTQYSKTYLKEIRNFHISDNSHIGKSYDNIMMEYEPMPSEVDHFYNPEDPLDGETQAEQDARRAHNRLRSRRWKDRRNLRRQMDRVCRDSILDAAAFFDSEFVKNQVNFEGILRTPRFPPKLLVADTSKPLGGIFDGDDVCDEVDEVRECLQNDDDDIIPAIASKDGFQDGDDEIFSKFSAIVQ